MKLGFLSRAKPAEPVEETPAVDETIVVEQTFSEGVSVLEPLEPEVDAPGPELAKLLAARGLTLQRSREVVINERVYVELKFTNGVRELATLAEWKI